ncbi:MAG: fatty acyl-AMP ligase, partial [Myxococcota bacterium]
MPVFHSVTDVVQFRAADSPERTAFTFLRRDGPPDEIAYGALAARVEGVAAAIAAQSSEGDRVLLMFRPGIDYIVAFLACLHAGRIAVPAYPPHPARLHRMIGRLDALAADAKPSVALTSSDLLAPIAAFGAMVPALATVRWCATDEVQPAERLPPVRGDIAFLQYTSGSTSTPRGVVLGHDTLLHNLEAIRRAFRQDADTRGVFWLPPYHDMGLIGGILEPLYAGYPAALMAPEDFLARPLDWLLAIERFGATTSGGPNFAYDLCVRKTTPEQRAALDLSRWDLAFNGAEPVRAETLARFAAAFEVSGFDRRAFYPCYGLAESTLLVTGGEVGAGACVVDVDPEALAERRLDPGPRPMVACGVPAHGLTVTTVDPDGVEVAPGQVGEIWVSGASVARGYWGREGDPTFSGSLASRPGERFLRTGDLGARTERGLVVTGRLRDLLVIRGRNVYPQDLELAAERAHPSVRPGGTAAFATGDDERVALVAEVDARGAEDPDAVARAIRRAVTDAHEVTLAVVALIRAGSIPKTSSGKIQRAACRAELDAGTL